MDSVEPWPLGQFEKVKMTTGDMIIIELRETVYRASERRRMQQTHSMMDMTCSSSRTYQGTMEYTGAVEK